MPRVRQLSAAVAATMVVSACTGDEPDVTPTTGAVVTTSTATTTTVAPAPLADALFSALAGRSPAGDATAGAVPGSPAALFVEHRLAAAALVGEPPASLTPVGSGYQLCAAAESCVTYDEVVVDPATGRVSSFAIDGVAIVGRVVGAGLAADADGILALVRSAYVTSEGELSVLLEVSNGTRAALELFAFAAAYQPESSGGAVEATGWWGESVVPAGAAGLVLLAFPDARLGGLVRLTGWREDAIDVSLELPVRAAD